MASLSSSSSSSFITVNVASSSSVSVVLQDQDNSRTAAALNSPLKEQKQDQKEKEVEQTKEKGQDKDLTSPILSFSPKEIPTPQHAASTQGKIKFESLELNKMTNLASKILSYLTILDLLAVQRVSKVWKHLVEECLQNYFFQLDMSPFWSALGIADKQSNFVSLFSRFHCAQHISFAFCHLLTDATLLPLLRTLTKSSMNKQRVVSINLYYCYQLTEAVVAELPELFPNLEEINLGRCTGAVIERSLAPLRSLKNLKKLHLQNIPALKDSWLSPVDHFSTKFAFLDIQFCSSVTEQCLDEVKIAHQSLKIIGPEPVDKVDTKSSQPS
eukprot:TRINITY_DN294_c2_g1_i1.p1 TRINITY_DN294_c2_g1~~TRINITY_DN294_c2_g1_i1.p1  ORF type:complete len:328 (+),score=51.89 TRINITY_DN294_c2_g1_i1:73-1056(+)